MWGNRLWVTAPSAVTVERFGLPDQLATGQVLVEAELSLISAGTELAIVMGTHIGFATGRPWPRYPMTLGGTVVGRITRSAPDVDGLPPGTRVIAQLPHASHGVAEARHVVAIPAACSSESALLAHLASVSMTGIRLSSPQLGEGMIVFGLGLIGALAARLGWIAGCRPVVGVDPLLPRRTAAARVGITPVDPGQASPAAVYRQFAGGRSPEIVVEATGAPSVINDALQAAGYLTRVVLLGSPRGKVEIDPYADIHLKGVTVIGAHHPLMTSMPASPFTPFTAERNRASALAYIGDGSLNTDDLITHRVGPAEAAAVYGALADREPEYLGVAIDWARGF